MNKFEIYKLIHFSGIFILMFAFGSLFSEKGYNKKAAMGHGIGLFLILLGGFGMQEVLHCGFPTWLIMELVIWLALGARIILAKRKMLTGIGAWVLIIGLASCAAFLGMHK